MELNELIRISKKSHYERFFVEHNANIKKVWEGIKELINSKTKKSSYPTILEINKNLITDPEAICNSFNNFFVNVADNILNERKYNGNKQFTDYLTNPTPNSFVYALSDASEVEILIKQLNISKASGPNGIPTNVLQLISNEISQPLSKICNIAFTTGVHPEKLKLVNTVPIFKKGSKLLVSNYRPISLLSNLNKIFEKLMYNRAYDFIEKHLILYPQQFGFRSNYSTTYALINITKK